MSEVDYSYLADMYKQDYISRLKRFLAVGHVVIDESKVCEDQFVDGHKDQAVWPVINEAVAKHHIDYLFLKQAVYLHRFYYAFRSLMDRIIGMHDKHMPYMTFADMLTLARMYDKHDMSPERVRELLQEVLKGKGRIERSARMNQTYGMLKMARVEITPELGIRFSDGWGYNDE